MPSNKEADRIESAITGHDGRALPLVLDLDGTLIRSDLLYEQALDLLRRKPVELFNALATSLFASKAALKDKIAKHAEIDPASLPYRDDLVDYARRAKENGRSVVLATASHQEVAHIVADHLGIFDAVFATDAKTNLKGSAKADRLSQEFGAGGFVYAGDSKADAAVWQKSGGAILVGKTDKLRKISSAETEVEFPDTDNKVLAIFKEMRIYQWVKNILVFVPMLAAGRIDDLGLWLTGIIAFMSFSLMASGVYILNDMLDLETDRKHPRKRLRPFASGALPIQIGFILAPALFLAGIGLSLIAGPALTGVLLAYAVLTSLYSIYLKTQPLVDVFTLACLYSVRVLGGGVATGVLPSIWLLSFSGLLFLSLAFLKRYHETEALGHASEKSRRGYHEGESLIQMQMGLSSGFASAIVFAIWLESNAFSATYSNQIALWLVTPLILLWQCRLWLAAFRNKMHDDPIVYTAKDRISWYIFALSGILYGVGLHA